MIIGQSQVAQQLAHRFAELVREDPTAQRLWAWSERGYLDPGRDYVELWLLADPINDATQDRIFTMSSLLHGLFPEVEIRVHLAGWNEVDRLDPAASVREGAEEVPLR